MVAISWFLLELLKYDPYLFVACVEAFTKRGEKEGKSKVTIDIERLAKRCEDSISEHSFKDDVSRLEGISDIIIEEGNMSASFWEAD